MMFFLANWQRILVAVGILAALGWIGWDRWRLDYYEAWTHHYEAVQKRNGEAIAAQNRAIRLMWLREKTSQERAKKAAIASNRLIEKVIKTVRKPIRFSPRSTCDQDVKSIFRKVRALR
jgi:hypothetical protein